MRKKYTEEERLAARKEASLRWREKNRERQAAKARENYWKDPKKANERSKKYHQENPEKIKAMKDAWVEKNIEKVKEARAKRFIRDREKSKLQWQAWYAVNGWKVRENARIKRAMFPEKAKASFKSWYDRNILAQRARVLKYIEENYEKVRSRQNAQRRANPEKSRIHCFNRRAKRKALVGKVSKDWVRSLFTLQKGKCPCCNSPLGNDYHVDHVIPLALGGANDNSNIQLLRARCNLQKRAQHPIDFMQSRGFLL